MAQAEDRLVGASPEISSEELGRRIAARRAYLDLSVDEAANRAGMASSSWSRYERGLRAVPYDRLVAVAGVLGIRIAALLSSDDDWPTRAWFNGRTQASQA